MKTPILFALLFLAACTHKVEPAQPEIVDCNGANLKQVLTPESRTSVPGCSEMVNEHPPGNLFCCPQSVDLGEALGDSFFSDAGNAGE